MKKLLLVLTMLVSFVAYSQTKYSKGWEDGYKQGYCYGEYGCIAPVAPIAPVSRAGESGYQDGYNRGFIKGRNDRRAKDSQKNNPSPAKIIEENNRYWKEYNDNKRSRTLRQFNTALKKAAKAFQQERYRECIRLYNLSKDLGWYDNKFEFATGVSYYIIWTRTQNKKYLRQAKKLLKLSIKHGNYDAKKILKEIKNLK